MLWFHALLGMEWGMMRGGMVLRQHGVGDGDDGDERLDGSEAARHQSRKIQEFLDAGGVPGDAAATVCPSVRHDGVSPVAAPAGTEEAAAAVTGFRNPMLGSHDQHHPSSLPSSLSHGQGNATAAAAGSSGSEGNHAYAVADASDSTVPKVTAVSENADASCSTAPEVSTAKAAGTPASSTHAGASCAGGILGGMTGFGVTFDWGKAVATAGGGAGSRAATVVEAMNKVSDWIGSFSGLEESLGGGGGGGGGRRAVGYGGERGEAGGNGNGVGSEEEGRREGGRVGSGERGSEGSEGSEGSGEGRGAGVQIVGSGQISGWSEDEEGEGESQGGGRKSNGVAVVSDGAAASNGPVGSSVAGRFKASPSLPSKQRKQQQEEEGEEDDEMVVMESVNGRHTAMLHMLQGRLSAVRHVAALWVDGELLPALSALAASKDLAVVADVLEVLAMQGGRRLASVGMEGALQLQPLLRALLASSHSKYVGVALSLLRELLRAFSEPITAARTATHSPGVDLHMEERLQRCNDCYEGFRVLEDQLHPILRRRSNENYALASDVHMLLQKMQ
ncbi:unnamed protein product [Closterium sp. Yama58-4]|nr:unnamed protein product [Closterium sp. Yama58-4]